MSNTDPDAVPKEKKMRKSTAYATSTPEPNMDTTPTRESFSNTNTSTAPSQSQHGHTLPFITPLPPSSEEPEEPTLTPANAPPSHAHKPSYAKQLNNLGRIPKKTLKLQGEILKSIMTLDNGLKLTSTPSGGFPVPQLGESVWRNIPPTLQAKWAQKPGANAWARLYRAKYEENVQATVAKLRNVITQLIGASKATDIVISPPTTDETLYERYSQPWHLLISGIPLDAIELLTSLAICTTSEVTCFFVPFEQPLPTYICTIENLTFQDSACSNLIIAQLVCKVLCENAEVSDFINSHVIMPDASTAHRAIDSIHVTSLNIAASRSSMLTIWNIYCDSPPPFSLEDYYLWSALICGLRFPSDDYGTGVPRLQDKQFTCVRCKSLDHPTGMCLLPATPGWLGPSNITNKEDLSMTSLDTRTYNSNSSGGQNSKRGANRGSGTRGRSNHGPRGGRGGPNFRGFKP